MAQSMVNFRLDSDVKEKMEKICKEMGMSMTTAFTIFATKVAREHRIPFEITADPFYSSSNLKFLTESLAQLQADKVVKKTWEELEDMENG